MALTDNLEAYYKLDESSGNADDSTANNRDMTNNNSVGYAAGKINNAGDTGVANVNESLTNTTDVLGSSFSIAGWINVTTAPILGAISTVFAATGVSGTIMYRLSYENDAGTLKLWSARQKNGVADQKATETVTLSAGTWYHVVLTYDTTDLKLYRNASEVATAAASGTGSSDRGAGMSIFALKSSGGSPFDSDYFAGLIDEVGFWSRALSSSEVTELYNSGTGLSYPFSSPAVNSKFFTFFG